MHGLGYFLDCNSIKPILAIHIEKILSFCKARSIQMVIGHVNEFLLGRKSYMLNSKKKLQLADRCYLETLKVCCCLAPS